MKRCELVKLCQKDRLDLPPKIFCILVGSKARFSVDNGEIRTVQVRENAGLGPFDPDALRLYKSTPVDPTSRCTLTK